MPVLSASICLSIYPSIHLFLYLSICSIICLATWNTVHKNYEEHIEEDPLSIIFLFIYLISFIFSFLFCLYFFFYRYVIASLLLYVFLIAPSFISLPLSSFFLSLIYITNYPLIYISIYLCNQLPINYRVK